MNEACSELRQYILKHKPKAVHVPPSFRDRLEAELPPTTGMRKLYNPDGTPMKAPDAWIMFDGVDIYVDELLDHGMLSWEG